MHFERWLTQISKKPWGRTGEIEPIETATVSKAAVKEESTSPRKWNPEQILRDLRLIQEWMHSEEWC